MMIRETKICKGCGKEFPNSEFASTWKNNTYTHTKCRACRKEGYRITQLNKKRETYPWEMKY